MTSRHDHSGGGSASSGGVVTFAVHARTEGAPACGEVRLRVCHGTSTIAAADITPEARTAEARIAVAARRFPAAEECVVVVGTVVPPGTVHEVLITVRSSDGPHRTLERRLAYSHGRVTTTRSFPLPAGSMDVEVEVTSMPAHEVGTALTVMAFNIWHGGRLDGRHEHGWAEENLSQLLRFLHAERPDVLFVVETYGAGPAIAAALDRGRDGRPYRGVQVTRQPDRPVGKDNLWLFTWLDIDEIYPAVTEGVLTSFNFGGARLALPDGRPLHVFPTWLRHLDCPWSVTTQSAMEIELGLDRSVPDAEIAGTDAAYRYPMARAVLDDRLPALVPDDTDAVIVAGDLNTYSPLDWSPEYADAPGHNGLTFDWPVLQAFRDAGFTDAYRWANPDVGRFPGRTLRPSLGDLHAPTRVDYVLTRGAAVRVVGSSTRSSRLPGHRGAGPDTLYPFYSDHAAVVAEIVIRGTGPGPMPRHEVVEDRPVSSSGELPPAAVVPGVPVPAAECAATADSSRPGSGPDLVIDGDPRTFWHSRSTPDPPPPHPHTITLDLGRTRALSGVRYQPRLDGVCGSITRFTLQAGVDGAHFEDVASGAWMPDQRAKAVTLPDVEARYLRLVSRAGVGGFSSAAELTVFERPGSEHGTARR